MWLYVVYASNSNPSYPDLGSAAVIFAICLAALTLIVLGRKVLR